MTIESSPSLKVFMFAAIALFMVAAAVAQDNETNKEKRPSFTLNPQKREYSDNVSSAIERLFSSACSMMPLAEKTGISPDTKGGITFKNGSPHTFQIYMKGPVKLQVTIPAYSTRSVELLAGWYDIAAEGNNKSITPACGGHLQVGTTRYSISFRVRSPYEPYNPLEPKNGTFR